ncbi:MAG: drug/metabolite transporter (DMT)-like permease [Gammaproteobacteria bacterium]|jgi:drug/metabolite transporter (DMT)-like permease
MTISHLVARRFNDVGIGADAVMGTLFLLTIVIAIIAELYLGSDDLRPPLASAPVLASTAFVLIAIPSFMLQIGISRASPLTANVVRSLAPVFVFAVQQFDDRLHYSGATLGCIVCFCILTIGVSAVRAWHEANSSKRMFVSS